MKRIITMMLCIILSTSFFQVSAESSKESNKEYEIVYETKEVAIYDCETGEEKIVSETYETYVWPNDLKTASSKKEFELVSPGYTPKERDFTKKDQETYETQSTSLTRISNPSSYEEYTGIVYIDVYTKVNGYDYRYARGSGFVIGPSTVATAGHVVYNSEYEKFGSKWASKVVVYPERTADNCPYGSAQSTSIICGVDWMYSYSNDDDWGIVRLDSNIGNKTGWLELKYTPSNCHDEVVMYAGYPKMDSYDKYLYYGEGIVSTYSSQGLVYADGASSIEGHSGCPTYQDLKSGYRIIGILTRGTQKGFGFVKFSDWLYNKMLSYRTRYV